MKSITVDIQILQNKNMCSLPLPFDSKTEFGQSRVPVNVKLNGYTYRSTIATMAGQPFIPLSKQNREAAGVIGGQKLTVTIEFDTEKRKVEAPKTLEVSLKKIDGAWDKWCGLSYTKKKEYAESIQQAKKEATRIRRINTAVKEISTK